MYGQEENKRKSQKYMGTKEGAKGNQYLVTPLLIREARGENPSEDLYTDKSLFKAQGPV
jgi:hypothetical protein